MKICQRLERNFTDWIDRLEKWRNRNSSFKFFSNRQIMNLIILLIHPTDIHRIKKQLFQKFYSTISINFDDETIIELTIVSLAYYLRSLPIDEIESFESTIEDFYKTCQLQPDANVDACLMQLDHFLQEFFTSTKQTLQKPIQDTEGEQYLVPLNFISRTSERKSSECTLDVDIFCILFNLFADRLPSIYQILWCSEINADEIRLFFSRIRTFSNLIFVIMEIDQMHPRLREVLLTEQDLLSKCREPYGIVYYFSRELTTYRRGLKFFQIPSAYRHVRQTYTKLTRLSKKILPEIRIICGKEGAGKSLPRFDTILIE